MKITSVLVSVFLVLGCMGMAQSFAQEDQRDVMMLSAEIVSLDAEEGILVVKSYVGTGDLSQEEIALDISGETVILLEDEEIEIYDLMTGDSVTIEHYTDDSRTLVATKVHLEYDLEDIEEVDIYEFE